MIFVKKCDKIFAVKPKGDVISLKCNYCGYEKNGTFEYCPFCGATAEKAQSSTDPSHEPAFSPSDYGSRPLSKVEAAVKDQLFFVICILSTVCCALSLLGQNLPLLRILLTIFLWGAYNKSKTDTLDANAIRNVSGTVFASYIINYIGAGSVILLGMLFSAIFNLFSSNQEFIDEFYEELVDTAGTDAILDFGKTIVAFADMIGVGIILAGVAILLFNLFGRRSIHKFLKSAYMNMSVPELRIEKRGAAQGWLIFFAVYSAVSAFFAFATGNVLIVCSEAVYAVMLVIASVLIGKHFSDKGI